jgi:hypothetical protein
MELRLWPEPGWVAHSRQLTNQKTGPHSPLPAATMLGRGHSQSPQHRLPQRPAARPPSRAPHLTQRTCVHCFAPLHLCSTSAPLVWGGGILDGAHSRCGAGSLRCAGSERPAADPWVLLLLAAGGTTQRSPSSRSRPTTRSGLPRCPRGPAGSEWRRRPCPGVFILGAPPPRPPRGRPAAHQGALGWPSSWALPRGARCPASARGQRAAPGSVRGPGGRAPRATQHCNQPTQHCNLTSPDARGYGPPGGSPGQAHRQRRRRRRQA